MICKYYHSSEHIHSKSLLLIYQSSHLCGDDHFPPLILCHVFLSISLNLSSSTILVDIFPNALKRATISFLDNFRSFLTVGRPASAGLSNSPENRILRHIILIIHIIILKPILRAVCIPASLSVC